MCFIIRYLKPKLIIVVGKVQVVAAGPVRFMVILLDYYQTFRLRSAAGSFTPVKTYACSKYISALDPELASRKHHSLVGWADLQ
tara:strand:- start:314 stop:565 length:252 start_codon:yes stop_codon:yes gene_type:complete